MNRWKQGVEQRSLHAWSHLPAVFGSGWGAKRGDDEVMHMLEVSGCGHDVSGYSIAFRSCDRSWRQLMTHSVGN